MRGGVSLQPERMISSLNSDFVMLPLGRHLHLTGAVEHPVLRDRVKRPFVCIPDLHDLAVGVLLHDLQIVQTVVIHIDTANEPGAVVVAIAKEMGVDAADEFLASLDLTQHLLFDLLACGADS